MDGAANSWRIPARSEIGPSWRRDVFAILAFGLAWSILSIAIPGFYSHDELDWQNRIARGDDPWSFGLGSITQSSFFRLVGTIAISASLRIPLRPIAPHLTEVLVAVASACLLYKTVSLFRPDRALASALLFIVTPGFAYSVGWIAAGFDVLYVFFGIISVLCAILYWRGGSVFYLGASAVSFAAALASKETALALPLCALLVAYIDRAQMAPRRGAIAAAVVSAIVLAYLALSAERFFRVSAPGAGGYAFGGSLNFLNNMVPYFGFPFAYKMPEIASFGTIGGRAVARAFAPHIVLLALVVWRGGVTWAVIYLIAFYATLLPVLPLTKYETQYTYGGSIATALALALVWDRNWFVAIPVAVVTVLLAAHNLLIQKTMYVTGVCQTRALNTLEAVLPAMAPGARPTILVDDDTPWWVVARAVHDNSFPLRGQYVAASITRDAGDATMVFHNDCAVTLRLPR